MINDQRLFKKLNQYIWEFRTKYNDTYYRLFAFWDKSDGLNITVVSTHALVKKTGRIPVNDIERAERLRKQYFALKKNIK